MPNETRIEFLKQLEGRTGKLKLMPNSRSLFESGDGRIRLYLRYSKRHASGRTFYGLRRQDIRWLEGHRSFICLIWDDQPEPLIIPFEAYEDLFNSFDPASDGQYKAQVIIREDATELYIAGAGRFNVESNVGWEELEQAIGTRDVALPLLLTHSQVQTLLGAIGSAKGFQVWIPQNDRPMLGYDGLAKFEMATSLPPGYDRVRSIAEQVDVIWIGKGSGEIHALYEVEHSTSIYSGLLRFNDIHLVSPSPHPRYSIVAEDVRRGRFARQLQRPTFQASGLHDVCSFLEYPEVYGWHSRLNR